MAKDVSIEFAGEISELRNSLDGMKSYIEGWGSSIKTLVSSVFGAFAAKELIQTGIEFVNEANEGAAVQAKLAAVIEATGGAAGFTADQMADMAMELRQITQVDDDVIKGAQTVIATFKEIRGDEFERTTAAAVDMAAVLGGDASGAAMQLAKALNDPEKGLTMLTKSGVGFTEAQKKMVAEMIKAGDTAGAQGVILDELEGQFGGAAKAAADATGPWAEVAFVMGDVRDVIGQGLLAVIQPLVPLIEQGAALVREWAGEFEALLPAVTAFVEDGLQFAVGWFNILYETATAQLEGISALWVSVFGEAASGPIDTLFSFVSDVFTTMIEIAVGYFTAVQVGWQNLPEVASFAWNKIQLGAVTMFEDLKHFFTVVAPELILFFADNWQQIFTDIFNFTKTVVENMFENLVQFFTGVIQWLTGEQGGFEWVGLTEGFESSLKELPVIAERELSGLEKDLIAKTGEQGAKLATAFQDQFQKNMEALGLGDVDAPQLAASGAAAAAANANAPGRTPPDRADLSKADKDKDKEFKSSLEDFSALFTRIQTSAASGGSPEAKAAMRSAEAGEKTASETEKAARGIDELVKETREMRRQRSTGTTVAVLGQ